MSKDQKIQAITGEIATKAIELGVEYHDKTDVELLAIYSAVSGELMMRHWPVEVLTAALVYGQDALYGAVRALAQARAEKAEGC